MNKLESHLDKHIIESRRERYKHGAMWAGIWLFIGYWTCFILISLYGNWGPTKAEAKAHLERDRQEIYMQAIEAKR